MDSFYVHNSTTTPEAPCPDNLGHTSSPGGLTTFHVPHKYMFSSQTASKLIPGFENNLGTIMDP